MIVNEKQEDLISVYVRDVYKHRVSARDYSLDCVIIISYNWDSHKCFIAGNECCYSIIVFCATLELPEENVSKFYV